VYSQARQRLQITFCVLILRRQYVIHAPIVRPLQKTVRSIPVESARRSKAALVLLNSSLYSAKA
jgi:hypothetical protein